MDHMYDTKQKRFQNTAKHLRTFCEKNKGFYPLTIFEKQSMLCVWQDFKYASAELQEDF